MRLFTIAAGALLALSACTPLENEKKTAFYVRGNCDMCKERIEETATSVPGVYSAEWDVNSSELKLSFDSIVTNEMLVKAKLSEVGHGSPGFPVLPEKDAALPKCCRKKYSDKPENV